MDAEEIIAQSEKGVDASTLRIGGEGKSGMTLRERFRRAMFFQKVDKLPNLEFGYWEETLRDWHAQGLPPEITDQATAYAYFGIEDLVCAPINVMGLKPEFDYKVIEENDETVTYRDGNACLAQINKQGHKSIPHYLDFHLKDRKSWEEFKERLKPSADRIPANWPELAAKYNQRDYPLGIGFGSMIGVPRNWIGFENIALMIYDDPLLLEEIVETLCNLVCDTLSRVLRDVEFDVAIGWEDICFNSGPIVGYDFMRKVVTPRYKRITDLLRKHGCAIAFTDCDGNIMPILDCFWDGGINCMFPVEVNGGSDPIEIRRRYPEMRMYGGFCKMKLAQSKQAIKDELKRLLPVVKEGGFIPGVDHRVQADVPYENYRYYVKLKRAMFGTGGTPQYDESRI